MRRAFAIRVRCAVLGAASCALLAPTPLLAQAAARATFWVQPEIRADVIAARVSSAEAGAALSIPLGLYVRGSLAGALGTARHRDESSLAGRVDASTRFLLDPFRERGWAPYGVGGVSLRHDDYDGWRPYLLLAVGLEGPERGGIVPAFELGIGGGARFGVVVRRAVEGRR